ncbi:6-phosphogluconolactonase [Sulfurovum sp.]|uniref:6-phosphogluconolactonase n=1 Tax=Sulfurovum sp. TaxID=1969726 RepID=UPI0025E24756|nr:6-phosphogluconolactonase [Sulfurovum sp.]
MMNKLVHFHTFSNSQSLADALSQKVATDLEAALAKKGKATLLVSGGSTPITLFEKLQKCDIDWSKVRIGLCDERWVPPQHPDSNERLIKQKLMQSYAAKAEFIGMYHDTPSAKDAQLDCAAEIKQKLLPFDVLILGMGKDAHTASLFPHNPKLKEGLDIHNTSLCIALKPLDALHSRMSLTLPAILSADHLYLHFEGEEKRAVYKNALEGNDIYEMPIRALLQQKQKKVEVYYA